MAKRPSGSASSPFAKLAVLRPPFSPSILIYAWGRISPGYSPEGVAQFVLRLPVAAAVG